MEPIIVQTQMLIRRPVSEVYQAFIDPAITTQFWFTRSSGPLEVGKTIQWSWDMYGVSTELVVKALEPNERILIEWDNPPVPVQWTFAPYDGDTTLVTITTTGHQGTLEQRIAQALDNKGGFTFVLAGLKAWLEHGINLNLVADHMPQLIASS